ncbi:MAG TPA: dienelactone hydrolase family protein [Pirellulaceae bacterium]|jgi:cephalosporin-C deacetylase-like acetyl esterase|nr:dienelactone hydrolase family protein [Pirellulaceae bacterium]
MPTARFAACAWTVFVAATLLAATFQYASAQAPETLPGTQPLEWEGDIASQMVDAADAFLLRRLEESVAKRPDYWVPADAPREQRKPSVERLKKALGLIDERVSFDAMELVATTEEPSLVATLGDVQIHRVRWPVFEEVHGEGLLFDAGDQAKGFAIVIPDADQSPEEFSGFDDPNAGEVSLPVRLASAGVTVVVPALITRDLEKRNGRANLTHREFLHRSAFVLGRTMTGYEVQKVLALVDWMEKDRARLEGDETLKMAVAGYGEGGRIALFAGAVDERIDVTLVSGYFGDQQDIWKQPLDRTVVGFLREFGDAELGLVFARRSLLIEPAQGPELTLTGDGGAPAELTSPSPTEVDEEHDRFTSYQAASRATRWALFPANPEETTPFAPDVAELTLRRLGITDAAPPAQPKLMATESASFADARLARQVAELDRFNQRTLEQCEFVREDFMKDLDTSSLEAYEKSVEPYRTIFREQVIGEYDLPIADFNARTRKTWETEKWTGYEVTLDVFDGVFAYGALLLPKDLKEGERRPVVVCQHGLEGRPTDTFLNDHPAYHDFAGKLAERGFVVFAPQNLYLFEDRFRTLQRKSYPLGTTLFSIIVPQHQQIVDWLQTQPFVDGERIGFYGLSYGGKSAMRIPALVTDYRLSICSADFNEWVRKNASTRHDFSYVWTGEYEIFEFDLGNTFNYAEMAALIAPRPFMVERGHFDGVGTDAWVAYEYAKVRRLYAAKLGIPERTEIEWFVGPHTIHGKGTFDFLHRHLDWPAPTHAVGRPSSSD